MYRVRVRVVFIIRIGVGIMVRVQESIEFGDGVEFVLPLGL
jgi:hypothetical protein